MTGFEPRPGEQVLWTDGPRRRRFRSATYVVTDRRLVVVVERPVPAVWWWDLTELGTPVVTRRRRRGAATIVFTEDVALLRRTFTMVPPSWRVHVKSMLWWIEDPDAVRDLIAEAQERAAQG